MNSLEDLEIKVLELEYRQIKKMAESGRPLPKSLSVKRTATPATSPKSTEVYVQTTRTASGWEHRTRDGKLLPNNRALWPAEIRKMVEEVEKVYLLRQRNGMLFSAPCNEPVTLRD